MRPTDRVSVGSITKAVISTGILKLANDGKLSLNDPISKYLPNLKFDNPWEATAPVRVQHLLDNTSGLADLRLWHVFSSRAQPDSPLADFYAPDPTVLKIHAQPGSVFSYSNMGFTLLGMIIESVTHQRYEDFLDREVLEPIGMVNSTFHFVTQASDKSLAMGHYDGGGIAPNMAISVRPAAQLITTAYDMGLFLKFVLNDGSVNGKPFINQNLMASYGKPKRTIAAQNGLDNGYSCGMYLRDRHGVKGLYGLGSIIGYRAFCYVFKEDKKAYFMAFNMDSETADYEAFNKLLIGHLGITQKNGIKNAPTPVEDFNKYEGYYVPIINKYHPYELFDFITGFTEVQVQKNDLYLKPFQQVAKKLLYEKANNFRLEDRAETSHAFYESGSNLYFTDGLKSVRKINGWVLFFLWLSFGAGLLALLVIFILGTYRVFKERKAFVGTPIFWVYVGVLSFLLPVPFFLTQPFVEIGNKSIAAFLLMAASVALTFCTVAALIKLVKTVKTEPKTTVLLTISAAQFVVLLAFWGLVPLRIWM